ncbi:MAG TPA: exodeoxyribonuclease VII small subunit [Thermoanaerobaculia bacterium]|jgi:exodeoxyribonuclease VII small subunit|nr:exodeoxyribonuclease VII small subunit [Thermoanaerobaculia bacterium]
MSENGEPGKPSAHAAGDARLLPAEEAAAPAAAGHNEAAPTAALTATAGQGEALGFRQAMDELEGILQRIEGEEIDIDQLAQELRRAAQLLDLCRGKIRKAEVEVTQIVQSLEEGGAEEDGERADRP